MNCFRRRQPGSTYLPGILAICCEAVWKH